MIPFYMIEPRGLQDGWYAVNWPLYWIVTIVTHNCYVELGGLRRLPVLYSNQQKKQKASESTYSQGPPSHPPRFPTAISNRHHSRRLDILTSPPWKVTPTCSRGRVSSLLLSSTMRQSRCIGCICIPWPDSLGPNSQPWRDGTKATTFFIIAASIPSK